MPDLGLEGDGGGFEGELRWEVEVDQEMAALWGSWLGSVDKLFLEGEEVGRG